MNDQTTSTADKEETEAEKHDIADLNGLYLDGESCDQDIFAEQRSNLLLVAGEHYNKRQSMFFRRIRDSRELSNEQKLRLTKNHIQKICKLYANNIISMSPNVGFEPKDEQSIQDQKAAELHHAVWRDAWEKYRLDNEVDQWCDDFIQIGETHVKIQWDPMKGKAKAFEQKLDDNGDPIYLDSTGAETPNAMDEMGNQNQLCPDHGLPVFEGEFVFKEIYGFNLLRSPQAKSWEDSPWLCERYMVDKSDLVARYRNDPEKLKLFVESGEDTFVVFDGGRNGYKRVKGQCMVREWYFRPCPDYPNGYFYFSTKEGIFEKGELPGGIFPIVSQGFDKMQTTPRGRSPIKHMRPYQVEINRAASKIAEHQVTLGDDKLLIQNGTKVSAGVALPGVRAINYTGQEPHILAGRAGDQYTTYMQSQIQELYLVMNVAEDAVENEQMLDPYALLFRSASQKKKFQRYIKRFEYFLKNVCKTYLQMAKLYLPEDQIIWAVGKSEQINIPEFKNANDICYQIIVEAQADDIETKLGKQLSINHVLQYVGPQMKPDDIGKLIRQMPYANFDGAFDDLTMSFEVAENMLLALDRGEQPTMDQSDPSYMMKKLTLRMSKPDFKFLNPQVQQMYVQTMQVYSQMLAQQQIQIQRAEQGYIPTGGQLLGCDFFVADPSKPSSTRRVRLPSEALQWLVTQMEAQGQGLKQLEMLPQNAQAQIASQIPSGANPAQMGNAHTQIMPPPASVGGAGGQGHGSPPTPNPGANGMAPGAGS